MLSEIYNLFYNAAKENIYIRSFRYGNKANVGSGEELLPQLYLECPIYCDVPLVSRGGADITINFSVISNIQEESKVKEGTRPIDIQVFAELCIKYIVGKLTEKIDIVSYSIIPLEEYTDNKCYGCRCTLKIKMNQNLSFCVDDYFDPDKELEIKSLLPDQEINSPEGCAVFNNKKLPTF